MTLLTLTLLAALAVLLLTAFMFVQKIFKQYKTKKYAQIDEASLSLLNEYLFEQIPDNDGRKFPELQREHLTTLFQSVKNRIQHNDIFHRHLFRGSIGRLLRSLIREVTGETKARIIFAHETLGFADEELQALSDDRWWIRAKACRVCGDFQIKGAVPFLTQLLEDKEETVRTEAAQALIEIGGVETLPHVIGRLHEVTRWMEVRLSRYILQIGKPAAPILVQGLKSRHRQMQEFCIDMIGQLGDISAIDPLIEMLDTSEGELKVRCLLALGLLGDKRASVTLCRYLQNETIELRRAASKALGFFKAKQTVPALKHVLLTDNIDVQLDAGRALMEIGESGHKALWEVYHNAESRSKDVAIQFLNAMGVLQEES